MFVLIVLGWDAMFIEEAAPSLNPDQLPLFLFSLLPGLFGVIVLFVTMRNTVTYISADDDRIALKFATGKIRKFRWRRLINVRVGGKRGTYIAFDTDDNDYAFNLNSVKGIIYYYEKAAQKKVQPV